MTVRVKKWGNSPAVRLSPAVLRAANISLEQAVRVTASAGKIIIEPTPPTYDINDLVGAITAENRHGVLNSSAERGAEAMGW